MKTIIRSYFLMALLGCPLFLSAQFFKFMDFSQATGKSPYGSVILDDASQTLYGMTYTGGANNDGTIFKFELSGPGFTDLMDFTMLTGSFPQGSLLKVNSTLFGMTNSQGGSGLGTIFKIRTDGTGFTILYNFSSGSGGCNPEGSLIISGNMLYGMASHGGPADDGVIFKIDTNGTGYTVLHSFSGDDGRNPVGDLAINGNMLYGMTKYGGNGSDFGTIFKIETGGANFTRMFSFDWLNSGGYPLGSLTLVNGDLYGMTMQGGANGDGVIFKISSSGIGFTKQFDFNAATSGKGPYGNLVYDGTSFFGMVDGNGSPNWGTIFSILPNGTNYEQIYNFTDPLNGKSPRGTPVVVPITGGTIFYGMMYQGGVPDGGVLFKYNTLGTGITPASEIQQLTVYPVPANDFLYVSSREMIREISILDILGKVVYTIQPQSTEIKIPVDQLNDGVYFLKVKGIDQTETRKFIKK